MPISFTCFHHFEFVANGGTGNVCNPLHDRRLWKFRKSFMKMTDDFDALALTQVDNHPML